MIKRFHEAQIIIAAVILMTAMFIYTFGPADRIQMFHDVVYVCLAFLFGKFTNGFTRQKPTRWDDLSFARGEGEARVGMENSNGQDNASTSVVLDYSTVETTDTGTTTRRGARYSNVRRE